MEESVRRSIAYAAYQRVSGKRASAVYSSDAGSFTPISASGDNFFDHDEGAHITSTGSGFFHHGSGAHVGLRTDDNHFSGFDHASGHHYQGDVSGRTVTLFDFGEGKHFTYQF